MRSISYNAVIFVVFFLLGSCDDGYNDVVDPSDTDYVTNDPDSVRSDLDRWLLDSFTYPYNIEIKYRWDASEGDIYRTLVPPKVTQIQPVMEVVKQVWIDPYADLAGATFIRTFCPKQFLLIGSAHYNLDGTFTLGTAEGGRKVVLYVVNDFQSSSRSAIKSMMHIVHHEFGHILNQKVSYPPSFREITTGGYSSDWKFNSIGDARANGFITNYAMASPDEDFVEMIATMLMEGKDGYEAIIECQTNAVSRELLRKKEELVVQYFKDSFKVDFYALQTRVQEAVDQLAPPDDPVERPKLNDVWGFEKEKSTLRFDMSAYNQSVEFTGRFFQDRNRMYNAGYALDFNFKLFYTTESDLTLRVYYYELADESKTFQQANFHFFKEQIDDDSFILYSSYADENGEFLTNELKAGALPGYFDNRVFRPDWLPTCGNDVFAALFPKDSPENFCYGILEQ